jgi:hypothetical protein
MTLQAMGGENHQKKKKPIDSFRSIYSDVPLPLAWYLA